MVRRQDIRAARERALTELAAARAAVAHAQAELRAIKDMCPHYDAVVTSHMGEPCTHCLDCGGCDVTPSPILWRLVE